MALAAVRTRAGLGQAQALQWAAALAAHSLHPVSRSLVAAAGEGAQPLSAQAVHETAGAGLTGRVTLPEGAVRELRLGSAVHCGLAEDACETAAGAPQVHLADDDGWLATFTLSERVRPDAQDTLAQLRSLGLQVHLLSGDGAAAARGVAGPLGIESARGDCTPQDKLAALRALQSSGRRVLMVGDGLNDGPVLAGAQVSIAFGASVPLARARADIAVLQPQLARVPEAIALARRTMRVVRQNLTWAAAYNAACVPLALAGWLPAWAAGAGMAASSLAVVLNSARLARAGRG
jgi:Cu2+-exporting ATPase